jgi:spore coat polysaccharide biosynthesis protein SpsF (cytidylyltransferase family)
VLDVNTRAEYERMAALYDALYPANPRFTIDDVLRWHDTHPKP